MAATSDLVLKPLPNGSYKRIIEQFGCTDLTKGSWVSGGSVRKVWFDLPWMEQDIDYFFESKQSFDGFTDGIKAKHESSDAVSVIDNPFDLLCSPKRSFMTCYSTDNANTYTFENFDLVESDGKDVAKLDLRFKLQAIRKYFPTSLDELFGSFDFNVCQFATDGRMMVATRAALDDCEAGRLSMVPNTPRKVNPVRVAKYCAYGFAPADSLMETVMGNIVDGEPMVMDDDY